MLEKHSASTARSTTRHARSRLKPTLWDPLRGRQTATTASSTGQLRRLRPREAETLVRGLTAGLEFRQSDPGDLQCLPRKRLLWKAHILEAGQ